MTEDDKYDRMLKDLISLQVKEPKTQGPAPLPPMRTFLLSRHAPVPQVEPTALDTLTISAHSLGFTTDGAVMFYEYVEVEGGTLVGQIRRVFRDYVEIEEIVRTNELVH